MADQNDIPPAVPALVVDAADATYVRELLRAHTSIQVIDEQEAPELRLVRWELDDAADHYPDIDALVELVRAWAHEVPHPGWSPLLEADHLTEVTLDPHVKTAVKDPEQVDPPEPAFVAGDPTGARVGIADARVYSHPELRGHLEAEPVVGTDTFVSAAPGHGTFVAGTVLRGAPHATLVCRETVRHGEPNRPWEIAQRLLAFLEDDVDVLNMSFGFDTGFGPPLAVARAVERLAEHCVVVAAVGNNGDEKPVNPMYPGALPGVLTVGAAPVDGSPPAWAPQVPWLDVEAPGVDVVGPFLVGEVVPSVDHPNRLAGTFTTGYVSWSGSSFAAAHVTGAIAGLMHDRGIDAYAARDAVLAGEVDTVTPYAYAVPLPEKGA